MLRNACMYNPNLSPQLSSHLPLNINILGFHVFISVVNCPARSSHLSLNVYRLFCSLPDCLRQVPLWLFGRPADERAVWNLNSNLRPLLWAHCTFTIKTTPQSPPQAFVLLTLRWNLIILESYHFFLLHWQRLGSAAQLLCLGITYAAQRNILKQYLPNLRQNWHRSRSSREA